jgi:hypothetical protein
MQPRVSLITLGVDDLDRAVTFYAEGMGLKTEGIVGREFAFGAVAFFELQGGLKLALWPRPRYRPGCRSPQCHRHLACA